MTTTNFPNGITSWGVPVVGGGSGPFKPFSTYYFVDADNFTGNASDGNPGTSPEEPLLTMARCFALLAAAGTEGGSGSVISFIGNVREQITAPLGIFDVTIIGCGNSPRHADAFDGDQGYSAATWRPASTPVAATPLLTIQSQGWRLQNFLLTTGVSGQPLVKIARNSESGDDEIDGGHFSCDGMRFDGAPIGIQVATTGFIGIYNSYFRGCTTAAINTTSGGPGSNGFWNIVGNRFMDNAIHIVAPLVQSTISNNVFGTCTTGINLTSGSTNVVGPGNVLFGTYDTAYSPGTSDTWAGNFNIAGITTANPT
jgi:hypothetical protein